MDNQLEIFVDHLFRDLGKRKVRRDIKKAHKGVNAQIDLTHGFWPFTTYVECKHKNLGYKVTYTEYSKFVNICESHRIRRRIMVTTTDFEERCYQSAFEDDVHLINGSSLHAMYRKSRFFLPKHHRKASLADIVEDKSKQTYVPSLKRRTINYSKWGLFFCMGMAVYEYHDKLTELIEYLRDLF